jgi:nicotinamidase-related amidase
MKGVCMKNNIEFNQGLVAKEDCVLIVIDVQDRLMPAISGKEALLQNALRLLKFSQLLDIPVVITEQEKLGSTLSEVTSEAESINVIEKVHFNCFMSGEFEHTIQKLERKTLILLGVEAHICVSQTALYALQSFKVHIIADAIGSRTIANRDIAIERMRQAGAIITSTEMFIYEALQRAGTDKFKAALQLVK